MKRNVWKLMKRPEGMDFEDALSLIEEDINDISDGNLIVKNKIISQIRFNFETFSKDKIPEDLRKIYPIKPGSSNLSK